MNSVSVLEHADIFFDSHPSDRWIHVPSTRMWSYDYFDHKKRKDAMLLLRLGWRRFCGL